MAIRTFQLVFSFTAVTNGPLELGIQYFVYKSTIS